MKLMRPLHWLHSILASLILFASCESPPPPARPPARVTVAKVMEQSVPVFVDAIGNVHALNTINIVSQVTGQVLNRYFRDGSYIKPGELLFTIDPRPYEAALEQSQGVLAENIANLNFAQEKVRRYAELVPVDYVSKIDYDQYVANLKEAEASVRQAQGQVEIDQINLGYCWIRCPFEGVASDVQIDPGNIVRADDSTLVLVTINQVKPIRVYFSIPEQYLAPVKKYQNDQGLDVEVRIPFYDDQVLKGKLAFINNTIDVPTGTIELYGLFDNEDLVLWPGQFVNVRLIFYMQPNSLLVPSEAVRPSVQGDYLFVIKPDQTAEVRYVKVGATIGGNVVILKGLAAGEAVVTEGQLGVAPGNKVTIVQSATESSQ